MCCSSRRHASRSSQWLDIFAQNAKAAGVILEGRAGFIQPIAVPLVEPPRLVDESLSQSRSHEARVPIYDSAIRRESGVLPHLGPRAGSYNGHGDQAQRETQRF